MHPAYEQHHLGRLLPPLVEQDFTRLRQDIAANGLLEEIVLYQGKILDGWSRYRACHYARVEPRFREFTGDNPVAYVLSKNVQRRHLHPVQLLKILEAARPALEAEAVARKRVGVRQPAATAGEDLGTNLSQGQRVNEQIASMAGISPQTVKHYHAVQVHGSADLKEAVDRAEVAVSDAADVVRRHSPETQSAAVARVRAGTASTLRQAVRQTERESRAQDRQGLPIPELLAIAFRGLPQLKETKACLTRLKDWLKEMLKSPLGVRLADGDWPALARQVGELRARLGRLEPYTLCPDCLGQGCPPDAHHGEPVCRGTGFLSRRQYQRLPQPAKERLRNRRSEAAAG
jgi:hypothetical protein